MKKKIYYFMWLIRFFVLAILIFATGTVSSQNAIVGTGFSGGWGGSSCPTGYLNFTYLGSSGFGSSYILTTTANGTGNQYWRFGVDWDGTTSQLAITHGSDIEVSPGTTYSLNTSCTTSGSMYYNVPDISYNYIFKTKDAGSSPTGDFIFFEVQGTVRSISSVSQSPTSGNVDHGETVTVTATLGGSLSTGQGVYLRYTDDSFTSSTVVEMSGSGTSYTADIPASVNTSGSSLTYYCFTSGDGLTISGSNADFYTINLNNNTGTNYSYIVSDTYVTAQDGDWNTAATWLAGSVPPAGADTEIKHSVSINSAVSNNPGTIEIASGSLITFGASGSITVNTSITNNGTTEMSSGGQISMADGGTLTNNQTFTGGNGTVIFSGAGSVSGTITFNDAEINGAVDFGSSSTIDGNLTLNSGSSVNTNPPSYSSNSTLTYNTGGTYNRNTEWNSLSGAGYPNNVVISNNTSLNIENGNLAAKETAGNLTINSGSSLSMGAMTGSFTVGGDVILDGTLILSTASGGDIKLAGDWNFNTEATFTHNSRAVFFNGSTLQQIGGTAVTTFGYLLLENSANVSLAQDITVANTLTFNSGKLILGNFTADLTAGSVTGHGTDKYVVADQQGFLSMTATITETVFPVGTSAGYAPASMTKASGTEVFDVRVKQGIDNSTGKDDFAVNLQWTIDGVNAGPNNVTVKLAWNESDENSLFDRNANVQMGRYSGSYTAGDATVAGYTAELGNITDDLSTGIPFVVANEVAFSSKGYVTAQNGRWQDGTTWQGDVAPTTDEAICAIVHHVTVESNLTSNGTVEFGNLTIYENKSLTLKAGSDIAVGVLGTPSEINNYGSLKTDVSDATITLNGSLNNASGASLNMAGGGTLTFVGSSTFDNSGSFTAGSGTVVFAGAGTATGTIVFNNLTISGGNVDLGISASLNGVLSLSGTGDLITNSITYNTGSILKFDRDYSLADDKIWSRNEVSTGIDQEGIPWNVEVAGTSTVNISDGSFRAINGDLTINGTFALSSTAGGDFKLREDFVNGGTFTHNNRFVEFNGTATQSISGSPTFYMLVINNAANVSLSNDLSVTNNITFTNGKLFLGTNNLIMSGATFSGVSSTNYIVTNGLGYLIQNVGTSEVTFPIGTPFAYNPAFLTQSGTVENMSVKVQGSIDNAVDAPTDVVNVQWTIDETFGTSGANSLETRFQWNANDEAGSFDRTGGDSNVETRYFSNGYLPTAPTSSTVAGTGPWTAAAGDNYTGNLSVLSFIVANNSAFSGDIETIANGDWSSASTWSGGVIPSTNADAAVIKHDVNMGMSWTVKSVSITADGSLVCNANTLTLADGGAIANTDNLNFTAGTGTVIFSGAGTISTGAITFNNVELNGSASFGSNATIWGTMALNSGASVNTNPPAYANGSILLYNQGGSITRGAEWQYNITSGEPGYPHHVTVSNSTTLDVDGDDNDDNFYNTRSIAGNLTVDNGSTVSLGDMGGGTLESQICGLYTKGDIINNGIITLSSIAGGDLLLDGSITNNGTINWNDRALFFAGPSTATQGITGINQIPFVLITNGSTVKLNNNLVVNGSGTEFITFARPSSTETGKIDLNQNILSIAVNGTVGNIELNDIAGAEILSSIGTGRVEVTAGNSAFNGTSSGSLTFGSNVTLSIAGGTLTFPSTLDVITLLGTLEIGDDATISNFPTYGPSSTLHYIKSGTFSVGPEWPAGSDVSDNIPFNVILSEGATDIATFTLDLERYAFGTLTMNNNATFQIAPGTGHLSIANLTVNLGGEIILKSPANMGAAGSLYISGTVIDNGTMTAERYLRGGVTNTSLYHYVSPPNIETNSQIFTNVHSSGNFNPNLYSYNEASDLDPDPGDTDYTQWSNFTDTWVKAHDGATGSGEILSPATGYAFYSTENKTYIYRGAFLSADRPAALTYNNNDANGAYFDGWNLIGNPYTCAIDWDSDAWTKTNIANTVYYWDGASGQYKYYNGTTGTTGAEGDIGENIVSGGSRYIPAGQAFFVKASANDATFQVPQAARVYNTQTFWKKDQAKVSYTPDYIKLHIAANGKEDETVLRFVPGAAAEYEEEFDAYKMYSNVSHVPHVFSITEAEMPLAINSLPAPAGDLSVPLGVLVRNENLHNFRLSVKEFEVQNKHVYLEDTETGYYANLHQNGIYNFTAQGADENRGRLVLHFSENTAPQLNNPVASLDYEYGNSVNLSIPENTFSDADLGDELTYRVVMTEGEWPQWLVFNTRTLEFSGTPVAAGEYALTLIASDIFDKEASTNFAISVSPANLTISTEDAERNYGEDNPDFTLNYKGFVLGDAASDLEHRPAISCSGNAQSPAGEYPIVVSGGSDNNYVFEYQNGVLTVLPVLPAVATTQVSNVGTYEATALGEILSNGGVDIIQAGFCYAVHENPTLADDFISVVPSGNLLEAEISDLQTNTTYFLRAYAQNSAGITYGESLAFKTTLTNVNNPALRLQANVYPNPSKGIFKLELNSTGPGLIRITDKAGKIIFLSKTQFEAGVNIINLSDLPAGEYNMEISVNGKRITKKISVQ